MIDLKEEFLTLVDMYQIQDGATRLIKAQELEDAFADRLQAKLLDELTDEQREEIIRQAEAGTSPEELVGMMFEVIEDVDMFASEIFEQFKTEFKANIE